MGWLIAALIFALAMFIPIGTSGVYDDDGGRVSFILGPFVFLVYPSKNDSHKSDKKKAKTGNRESKSGENLPNKGGSLADFYPFITLIFDFLCDFRRKLRVSTFRLHVMLSGGDPADLALNYGKTWASVGALWPALERFLVIKNRDIKVQCDFEDGRTSVFFKIYLTVTIGRLLSMVLRHGTSALKEFLKFRKKRNGGTV